MERARPRPGSDQLEGDVLGGEEELDRHELLRAGLRGVLMIRWPVNRQTMIALANPSIAESMLNPTHSSPPSRRAAAIVRRVGSPSAFARPAAASAADDGGRDRRSASATGRSGQRRSHASVINIPVMSDR
jgi:hypothetical protein